MVIPSYLTFTDMLPKSMRQVFVDCSTVCVCERVCMSVYRPPGALYQLDWDPLTIPASTVYAPKLPRHGRKSIVTEEKNTSVEENKKTFWTNVKNPWLGFPSLPGKVPELGPQMLRSYLHRFLHEELNCCNIGLGGRL